MLKVWSEKKLTLHLQSGRVIWRQCPSTPGVWEYKDTQKFSKIVSDSRTALGKVGQDSKPGAEHLEKFESLYNEEAMGLHDSGLLLGKGKGKRFRKRQPWQKQAQQAKASGLPEPPSEEQILAQTRKQASKAEAMVHKLQGELGQTLEKVKSKLSRKKQTTALGHLAALKKVEAQLQASLKKGCLPLSSSTKLLDGKGSKGGEEGAEPLGGQSPQCGQLQEEQKVSIFCSASLEKHVKLGKAKQLYIPASQACLSVWPCL